MSNFPAYIIDFYMTVSGDYPVANIVKSPSLPSINNLSNSINDMITYINANGINLNNYSFVNSSVTSLIASVKSSLPSNATLTTLISTIQSSISDNVSLVNNLNSLLTYTNSASSSTSFTPPENDTKTTNAPIIIQPQRNRRPQTTTNVIKFKSLGTKVAGMQANANLTSTTLNTFTTKVKNAVHEITDPTPRNTNALITTTRNGRAMINSNFFNNLVGTFVNGRDTVRNNRTRRNRRNIDDTDANTNEEENKKPISRQFNTKESINELNAFNKLAPTVDPTSTPPPVNVVTDSYEISTSQNGDVLTVTFSYFPAGATLSSFSCTYNLTMPSLISLTKSAFDSIMNLSASEKQKICDYTGCSTSSTPSSLDLWTSILVWMFSFISFGVASQLGADITVPYSGSTTGSANYMLNQNYINNISNIALPIYLSTKDSSIRTLLMVCSAREMSDLLYADSSDSKTVKNSYGSSSTIANSLISMINTQTTTSTQT